MQLNGRIKLLRKSTYDKRLYDGWWWFIRLILGCYVVENFTEHYSRFAYKKLQQNFWHFSQFSAIGYLRGHRKHYWWGVYIWEAQCFCFRFMGSPQAQALSTMARSCSKHQTARLIVASVAKVIFKPATATSATHNCSGWQRPLSQKKVRHFIFSSYFRHDEIYFIHSLSCVVRCTVVHFCHRSNTHTKWVCLSAIWHGNRSSNVLHSSWLLIVHICRNQLYHLSLIHHLWNLLSSNRRVLLQVTACATWRVLSFVHWCLDEGRPMWNRFEVDIQRRQRFTCFCARRSEPVFGILAGRRCECLYVGLRQRRKVSPPFIWNDWCHKNIRI